MCDLTDEVLIIIIATKPILYKKKTQLITLSLLLNNDASLLYLRIYLKDGAGLEPALQPLTPFIASPEFKTVVFLSPGT